MEPPKALIFDIDDTLVDTTPSYRGAIILTAAHFGGTVTLSDIANAKAEGDANNDWELTRDLLVRQRIFAPLDAVIAVFEDLYQGVGDVPGLKTQETLLLDVKTIQRFAERFKLGIVTGRPRRDANDFLELHKLQSVFQAMVTMDDGPLKPSPEPMLSVLSQLDETDAWMIGDTPDDIRSAVGAHIRAIGVIAPADDPEDARLAMLEAGAELVLDSITELEALLYP